MHSALHRVLLTILLLPATAWAAIPSSYDLRDVDGAQQVNTRLENQIGAGPCWAFGAMVAIESNILIKGLWSGVPADLDLSQQWLRMNESSGYGGKHTWNADPDSMTEGFSRDVNGGGNWNIAVAHMARLHGPVLETASTGSDAEDIADGRPFVYKGALLDDAAYYDGSDPKWPERGFYAPAFRLRQALRWTYEEDDPALWQTLKQVVRDHGALYVSFSHRDAGFTADAGPDGLGTYYDDGSLPSGGLGGHAINIIGWDDSVDTDAPRDGAWLIKQSHPTATSPSYFWLAYESTLDHVVSYRMAPMNDEVVYSHAYGAIAGTEYKPAGAHQHRAASVYAVGPQDQQIGSLSFETDAATDYTIALHASLADLQNGASALASVSGTSAGEGYHTVDLDPAVTVAANSAFVVSLSTPDRDLPWIYYTDNVGSSGVIERTHAGEHYYLDTTDNTWKDVYEGYDGDYNHATNCAWSLRAYTAGTTAPPPQVVSLDQSSWSVDEDAGSVQIGLTRSGGSDGLLRVRLRSTDDSATAGTDYTALDETISWSDGEDGQRTVALSIIDDSLDEADERLDLTLSVLSGDDETGTDSATVTIIDDDQAGSIEFRRSAWSVDEQAGTVPIALERSGGSDGPVSVNLLSDDATATAGSDYEAIDTSVAWDDGEDGVKRVDLVITDDSLEEDDETLQLAIGSPTGGVTIGAQDSAVVTIQDDDAPDRRRLRVRVTQGGEAIVADPDDPPVLDGDPTILPAIDAGTYTFGELLIDPAHRIELCESMDNNS